VTEPNAGPVAATPVCYRHPNRETWIRCQRCDRPICPDCMNSAAVGFQCPSCIREGARTVRSPRAPYGGTPSANPAITSLGLIALNIAVWLSIVSDHGGSSGLVDRLSITPQAHLVQLAGGQPQLVDGVSMGAWWQVVTSAFAHVSPIHIGMNMLALYFLGPALEGVLGRARFLAVYGVSTITASAGVMLFSDAHTPTLGASGAIFGLLGSLIVIAVKVRGDVRTIVMWLGLNLFITFTVPNISWQGHIGGLVGGALVTAAIVYAPRARRAVLQWTAVAAVLAFALVLIVVRAQTLGSFYTQFHVGLH
jgi:membrane associated rhomboid family serine protease